MINGSCLCGEIKFAISGKPYSLSYCHCSRCRKTAGIFSTVLIGKADDFHLVQGRDAIAEVEERAEAKFKRYFCKKCGSSLGDMTTGDIYVVAASALDDDPGLKPSVHIHVASKSDWYEISDDLPQFEGDYVAPD